MSTETEQHQSLLQPEDVSTEHSGKPKRSYTIEFILSFSELEVCKKLPDGFDKSLLSEFEDASYGTQDRQRVLGSSPLQGFRRTDYGTGSSPPARGDTSNYSRGVSKWDSRTSGRSDTDSDSEAGRRFSSQARKLAQNAEHDGLLGSGSFPRPVGFVAGASVPRFRPNGSVPVSKSNETYQPPRPYKAVPHPRRETNDSFNDETFGSTESTGEDRAEEEKKRRAEFELMRKEQQKVLQENQKSNSGKVEDPFSAIARLSGNSNDRKVSSNTDKVLKEVPEDNSSKLPIPPQAPPSRPVVPPGFVNSVVDKSSTAKALVHGASSEVRKFDVGISRQDMKSVTHTSNSSKMHSETTRSSSFKPGNLLGFSSAIDAIDTTEEPSFPDVSEVLENGKILVLDSDFSGHKLPSESGQSTSVLEKLFGNTSTTSSARASKFAEDHDIGSPNTLDSKFARWFIEDDKKSLGDTSSERPNDLLSLIGGGVLESAHSSAEISVRFPRINGPPEPKAAVLTCEDLEQSILSEVGRISSNSQPPEEETSALDAKVGAQVDSQASHHLLSLLQRGTGPTIVEATSKAEQDVHGSNSFRKTLTLESLFGTAFMKELHSAQDSSGSVLHDSEKELESSEEDSFTPNRGNLFNPQNSALVPDMSSYDQNSGSARRKDERLMQGGQETSYMYGPYEMTQPDLPFQNLHPQPSSPRFHAAAQMNPRTSPLFPAHLDPNLNFVPPPYHTSGLLGFDQFVRPPMLGFPHPGHGPGGYGQMHGFPFGQQQPRFGGPGMAAAPPHPPGDEALQRLLEMELRATNPKQTHAFGGHARPTYGHELDMGFRYR